MRLNLKQCNPYASSDYIDEKSKADQNQKIMGSKSEIDEKSKAD